MVRKSKARVARCTKGGSDVRIVDAWPVGSCCLDFVRTYVKLDDKTVQEYEHGLLEPENLEVQEMTTTWAEDMEAKGRLEGKQELVLELLAERFGSPSEEIKRRIAAVTSAEELKRLAARVFKVDSPEELGLA